MFNGKAKSKKYNIFFDEFYKSCEEKFIKNANKKYFVFTDSDPIFFKDYSNVEIIY